MNYLRHFGLREPPFGITPDTSYFFPCRATQEAFNALLATFRLAKATAEQAVVRSAAVDAATRACIAVPMSVLARCPRIAELCLTCARQGNQSALSDAGTALLGSMAAAIEVQHLGNHPISGEEIIEEIRQREPGLNAARLAS